MRRQGNLAFALFAILICLCFVNGLYAFDFPIESMRQPPGNLKPSQVPQFVSFGVDDNPYSGLEGSGGGGALHYLTELFSSHTNPAGDGKNFDGKRLHYAFYVNTIYITPEGEEDPRYVKQSWKEAIDHGNEIGVHTHSHPHGRYFTVDEWTEEMQKCMDLLTSPDGMNLSKETITGFRTPFLEYGDNTLSAAQRSGFVYDCSVEEGFRDDENGGNFVWPYLLDHGSPGNASTYEEQEISLLGDHPGLWELPVYAFIVPPDELCDQYGVKSGFRARMKEKNDYFEIDQGKITGMDWNLWFEYGMTSAEFLATLKYTFDLHLKGNRSPMDVGLHSAIYADRSPENPPGATVQERRDALAEFLDYALTKPETRVVSARELLAWLKSPSPLQNMGPSAPSKQPLGAGFRFSVYGPKYDPGPEYWANVGKEMSAKFPGASPEAIWIVSKMKGKGTELAFPIADSGDPLISGRTTGVDSNEAALDLFDRLGFRVWLQVEPGFASVEKLIHLILKQYGHHSSVIGVGVDVEWNQSTDPDGGEAVSDDQAKAWLAAARTYNPKYRLFLKHWLPEKMPPTFRDGLLFVDDSQIFPSIDPMIDEFEKWGKTFAPYPVAYQFGYPSDRPWWHKFKDPSKEIGSRVLRVTPNTESLFWVDFSVLEVFPPDSMKKHSH